MHPIHLFLLLPLVLVTSLPTHPNVKHSGGEEPTNEFWSHHFGPDFHHAIHLHLKQTDLINTGNVIEKSESEPKDGNKKRSAYILHKPNDSEQENRTLENAMRVHLLQPGEAEALEKEMISYARGNKMVDAPMIVNLPASAAQDENGGHVAPVVLSMPPVVYHSNPRYVDPRHLGHVRGPWAYNRQYPSLQNHGYQSYEKLPAEYNKTPQQGYEQVQNLYEKDQPVYEKMPTAYEHKAQNAYESNLKPVYEEKNQYTYENSRQQQFGYESNTSEHQGSESSTYEVKMHPGFEGMQRQAYNENKDVKDGDQKEKV